MSTSNLNTILKGSVNGQGFHQHEAVPCNDSTVHINQGDLVYWDSSAHLAKPVDSDAHAATLLGAALKPSKVSSSIDSSTEPNITVGYGAVGSYKTTSGDTYNHGDLVYIGADAQTITNATGSSNAVGVVQLPSKGSAVSGGAGINVPILVYSRSFVKLAN